jgi:hypothetical protein
MISIALKEAKIMTSLGSLLWIAVFGVFLFFMMKKGGGCCGGGHDKGPGSDKKELGDHTQGNDKEQPRGGCCG